MPAGVHGVDHLLCGIIYPRPAKFFGRCTARKRDHRAEMSALFDRVPRANFSLSCAFFESRYNAFAQYSFALSIWFSFE